MANEDVAVGDDGDGDDSIDWIEECAKHANNSAGDVVIPDTFGVDREESSKYAYVSHAVVHNHVVDQSAAFDNLHPEDDGQVEWKDQA